MKELISGREEEEEETKHASTDAFPFRYLGALVGGSLLRSNRPLNPVYAINGQH
jgi:hypothetical protein